MTSCNLAREQRACRLLAIGVTTGALRASASAQFAGGDLCGFAGSSPVPCILLRLSCMSLIGGGRVSRFWRKVDGNKGPIWRGGGL
jgi:hypothetical protein